VAGDSLKGQGMSTTKETVGHHLKCFGEGNLDGILSDYAPTTVLFMPDGPLKGTDAIRPAFTAIVAEFGKPGTTFAIKHFSVDGDHAYILWTAETADNIYEMGTDAFVVRDGKIVAQSFAAKITPKG
jgi:ketosteroid isomerase-like protein